MRRVYGLCVAVPAAVFAGGCASGGGVEPANVPAPAPLVAVHAGRLFEPGPSKGMHTVLDADTGEPIGPQRSTATALDADGRWQTETVLADEPPRRAGYVRLDDGAIALAWSRSVKDTDPGGPARLYVFDPPLVMAPAALRPGEVFEAESRMTERDPRDEERVALRGRASRRLWIEPAGDEHWSFGEDAPAGQAVVGEMRIEVGPATALRRTVTLVSDGPRDGEEVVDYSIRVLGLRFKHERTRLVPGDAAE